jgi:site-specific recombinase XerD
MSISTPSGFEPVDWATPWRVERPSRNRPPLGPERHAWLEQRLLFQSARSLKSVLDQIDPAIARNEAIAAFNEDIVMNALLDFFEPTPLQGDTASGKRRMPQHRARVFLDYFARGFRHYCQAHGLRHPRLPLIQEFSLDEGSLQAGTFSALHEYRRCVRRLIEEIEHRFITPGAPNLSTEQVAALLLCSSALFGGLARKVYWQAFLTALASPLQRSGDSFSFRFNQRPPYRWIADPVTEALLRRLWQWRLLPLPEGAKISPTHIRQLLGLEIAAKSVLSHLEHLVRSAHVRHFAPDVAAVAQGRIQNTALADEPWLRLISGTRHAAPRATVALTIPRLLPTAQANTLQQVALQTIIDDIGHAIAWDPQGRRQQGNEGQSLQKHLSDAKVALRAAEGKLSQLYARAGHPEGHGSSFAYGLLCYARDLLELGGLKLRNLAPGTISNYVSILRNHLTPLHFADLVTQGTEARADAYRKDIRQQQIQDRTIHRTAFEGFERSLLRHMDLIDEVDWATIPGRARNGHLPSVDANLVDTALYRHVFRSLESPARHSPLVELARALLVILYRFGLRTGEAAEVTIGALMLHTDGRASLRVTASTLTSRKSVNALRLVGPITLPRDEYDFLANYRNHRTAEASHRGRERAGTYLFATGTANRLEHVEPAQALLIEALRAASGDTHLRPRHLRHSFVSRAFLAGRNPLEPLDSITLAAAGDEWRRSFATGHASPDTGIVSYTHVVEFAHHHYTCQLVGDEVPLSFLSRVAGNDARSLERMRLRHGNDRAAVIKIFRESLRRNFPCVDTTDMLAKRMPYQEIKLEQTSESISNDIQRLKWEDAWEVYASARIGLATSDMSEHGRLIRERVRDLELRERLGHRLRRRPQLAPGEAVTAAVIWQTLSNDRELQTLICKAIDWLRPRGPEILMPAAIARELEVCLQRSGLTRIQSRQGTAQRRWLSLPDANGNLSTTWLELLAFLYAGRP